MRALHLMSLARRYPRHPGTKCFLGVVLVTAVGCGTLPLAAAGRVAARTGQIELATYPWSAVKHPYFRGTDKVNIYPYPMLDFLSRERTNRTYRTVVLENEYLRVTILPELGGKIHEVIDKTTGQPMFYVNHVVKPGLIGQCGAWTSGGVEWNTGPQGHTVSCLQPVGVLILPEEKDGSRSVAIGETERIYGTKWTVVVTLRPGRSFIEERIRIYNPTETIRPYYFWNCTATPNTPGFRFIYPMTLGMDHSGDKFFQWPIHEGRDLTRGTNYQDASSIFAYHCDQDFFGSYNDDLGRGVVSFANHHQLPGKKAWTWGHGSFGTMHQADLTDTDGPYNEVQTGPLLTQGEVGRLDPCEAVEWKEWWYPVHGLDGFTFANRDVAVNASRKGNRVSLRLMGTRDLKRVEVRVSAGGNTRDVAAKERCHLSPRQPTIIELQFPEFAGSMERINVEVRLGEQRLALFPLPVELPKRTPPVKKSVPQTATELVEMGWQDFLFARYTQAETQFRMTLEKDPKSAIARTGLAFLRLDSDAAGAAENARAALEAEPNSGLAHLAVAVAEDRLGNQDEAMTEAWNSSLDAATAVAGRALVAKLHTRRGKYQNAVEALSEPGPWQTDPLCRNRLAFALLELGDKAGAVRLAKANLAVDPLDEFAQSLLWLAKAEPRGITLGRLLKGDPHALLELVAAYAQVLHQDDVRLAQRLLEEFYLKAAATPEPIADYWAARGYDHSSNWEARAKIEQSIRQHPSDGVFPHQIETVPVLKGVLVRDPKNGRAALYLGHLLFHLGRHSEGREMWKRAAELGVEPVIAYRALGMAAKTLDNNPNAAREWLEKANKADGKDSIVARDLARVLFELADKAAADAGQRELVGEARDRLKGAFAEGKGRSDFVALLARAQNRLGDFAETAVMLDSVRVTVWEGAHEVHDLFEQAHLALGEAQLKAGKPAEALAEFNRALEYPANLATGKLEKTAEAHIHFQRGNALAALGRKPEALAAWKLAADEPESKDARIERARQQAKEALEK